MRFLLLAALSLTIAACSRELDASKLVERQGVFYEVNSTTPFSGTMVSYYDNGQLENKAQLRDGLRHGKSSSFFPDGQLKRVAEFEAGWLVGVVETYYENGQLSKRTNYSDGQKHGLSESYHQNGQLAERTNYSDGQKHGLSESYHQNGQLAERANFIDGRQKDGLFESYHENGLLYERTNFIDGQKDGLFESYYAYGRPKETGTYAQGKKEREWVTFFSDGSIAGWSNWENGTRHGASIVVAGSQVAIRHHERGVEQGEWLTYDVNAYPRYQLIARTEWVSGKRDGYELLWNSQNPEYLQVTQYKDGSKHGCQLVRHSRFFDNYTLYDYDRPVPGRTCRISAEELAAFPASSSFPDPSSFLPEELRQYATWKRR